MSSKKNSTADIISQSRGATNAVDDEFNPLLDSDDSDDEMIPSRREAEVELPLPDFSALVSKQARQPELPKPPGPREVMPTYKTPDPDEEVIGDDLEALLSEFGGDDLGDEVDPFAGDQGSDLLYDTSEDVKNPSFQAAWGGDADDDLDQFDENAEYDDEDELAGFDLDAVLGLAIEVGASDVHISADDEVDFTVLGDIVPAREFGYTYGTVSGDVTQRLQLNIISHVLEQEFTQDLELDTSYVLKAGPHAGRRTRLSIGRSFGNVFLVFRVIADKIPTPEDLKIEDAIIEWCSLPNGLVMICGPTGTGKSTTFASMVQKIIDERPQKIITLEKPVEYVFSLDGKARVTQREVGRDARSFSNALTSAMRQAPNIIMIGEARDQHEVDEVLRAAETGHLVLTTIHASSPPGVINRIKSLYSGNEQKRILGSLRDNVRGIANQVLVKTLDGESRFAVRSILSITPEVAQLIGEGDVEGINEYMRQHELTMEHALVNAVKEGKCTLEAAKAQSPYPAYFDELMAS